VAYGVGRDAVVGMRIPLGQGIAGYVAMTGQPLAVSDVQRDARVARETAQDTGYVPRSILATPLLLGERVIGVMEVLDKIDAASFGLQDMELLALFARQAAMAIDQAQRTERLGEALVLGLRRMMAQQGDAPAVEAASELLRALQGADDDADRATDMLALADLLSAVSALGPGERRMALQVLSAVADYARSKRDRTSMRGRAR
jgi:GAF domain-containing protein